jgi:methylamine--corrinoid protein Co-methyltransferase
MSMERVLNLFDLYGRFVKGEKVSEDDWDNNIIPSNVNRLKKKYKLSFGRNTIPDEKATKTDLFNAGLEMLVDTGFYNTDLKRMITVTETEVLEGIRKTPKQLILGEGRDSRLLCPRRGNSPVKPIVQGGPTGAPVSEDIFVQVMQSYAQEAVVDTLVSGIMPAIEGHPAAADTPYKVRALMAEARAAREASARAGRPNMSI